MKVSMKNWRQNRMKQFWLHTLLRTYSSVMMIIIASFAILLSYADWDSREKEAQRVAQRVTTRTVEEVEYYYRESAQLAQDLVANQDRIQGVYKYFSLSTSEYFYWLREHENWFVGMTSHGYQVQVAVPKNFVLQGTVSSSALIVGLSLLFIVILYLTLRKTFANYQKQVVDLVDSIHAIAQGQEGLRIDTLEKDQELLLIAETTNDMLDRLEKNIHDIYQLELSQKDANMRALQAQINPHFMYNTLEFLRMYAVMQSQDELADIIYEFSSLLRNNISDERETLLKQELEFCRKYSYLCMVRYPKSIAYGFKIDPELENMKIPKFTLQPLVENYFAHGVDHRRTDNVISIKALKQDGFVEILVVDNGRGMSSEKLASIREKLRQRHFEHQASYSDQKQSIGIVNVHERFVLYFGDRYAITIDSAEQVGVQYRITIQDE